MRVRAHLGAVQLFVGRPQLLGRPPLRAALDLPGQVVESLEGHPVGLELIENLKRRDLVAVVLQVLLPRLDDLQRGVGARNPLGTPDRVTRDLVDDAVVLPPQFHDA